MHVAFCSSEVFPFEKTGGLADVCGALPLALETLGVEVSIFLPHYKSIEIDPADLKRVNDRLSETRLGKNVRVYFIENDLYFDRDGLYGDAEGDYPDNLDRFQFYCHEVIRQIKILNIPVDIVHCHDWQTALIPVYLKNLYQDDPVYKRIKTVLTIHNLAFQGVFPREEYPKLNLPEDLFSGDGFEFYEKINLLKAGIIFADSLNTVSQQYALEIQTKEYGCGLDGVIHARGKDLHGIVNGLDYCVWNPAKDTYLKGMYAAEDAKQGKAVNKHAIQDSSGLSRKEGAVLFGFVGRLSHQKGIDLIIEAFEDLKDLNVQMIIQGVGDQDYCDQLKVLAQAFPDKVALNLNFDEQFAHRIYAGSDYFLMPSTFEPCGLSQMISMRYGTVPLVAATGGLVDTVDDGRNGFVFKKENKKDFVAKVRKAVDCYSRTADFDRIMTQALKTDFSWGHSAQEYQAMYQCLLSD